VSTADGFCACLGKPKALYLACLDQVFYGTGGLFDGSVGVDAMLVEQVDSVGLQTFERGFDNLLDVIGTAVGRGPLPVIVWIGLKTELGSDYDFFAEWSESFADDFFIDIGAVDFGGRPVALPAPRLSFGFGWRCWKPRHTCDIPRNSGCGCN
jgi:hypothetical protein